MLKIQIDNNPYALKVDWYENEEDIITFEDIEMAKLVKLVMETQRDLLNREWNTYQCLQHTDLIEALQKEIGEETLIEQFKKVKMDEDSKKAILEDTYYILEMVVFNYFKEYIQYDCPDMAEDVKLYSREVNCENKEVILKEIK